MIEEYFIHLAILICIYIILAVSLQVSFGCGGLLNLGHVAFFGIGAYVSALLLLNGFSFIISLIAVIFVTGAFGWFLSILTRKLTSDYLALVTLGFSFVVYAILLNWKDVTGGPQGEDKRARLTTVSPLVKNATILFPVLGTKELEQQLISFGIERYDDLADAFAYLAKRVQEEIVKVEPNIYFI